MNRLTSLLTQIKNSIIPRTMSTTIENPNVIISLTTVPERLKYWISIEKNLNSLLHQKTDREYRVIFTIPRLYAMNDNEEYPFPDELAEFAKNNPKLVINRDTKDYGPITKIYGGLNYITNPEDILIACDDDHLYHEEMLEYHINKLNQYPNHAICFRGDVALEKRPWIDDDKPVTNYCHIATEGVKKFVMRPSHIYFPTTRETYLGVPGHWHSVGYRRKYFGDDFNEDLFSLADGDDPLVGYYLKKHDIFVLCAVWDKMTDFRPIVDSSGPTVWYTFPIVEPLGFPVEAGGYLIRQKNNETNHGRTSPIIGQLLTDYTKIYIEKNEK